VFIVTKCFAFPSTVENGGSIFDVQGLLVFLVAVWMSLFRFGIDKAICFIEKVKSGAEEGALTLKKHWLNPSLTTKTIRFIETCAI